MSRARRSTSARPRTRGLPVVGAAAAVVLTVLLGQSTAAGSFSGRTGNAANTVGTASSFCVAGPQDVVVTNDTFTAQDAATTAHATTPSLITVSTVPSAVGRSWGGAASSKRRSAPVMRRTAGLRISGAGRCKTW